MATLDPTYQGGTVATPVINDNSTLTAIKGLTGVASSLLALRGSGDSGGSGGTPFDPEYATALQKARSLENQGKAEEATRIRARATNRALLAGTFDPGDSSHTKAYEAFAGMPFEGSTLTPRERQIDALESDENYMPSLMVAMSQNPDADQDTLRGLALARTANMQAGKAVIEEAKLNASLNWTTQMEAMYLSVLKGNQEVLNASLEHIAATGRSLPREELDKLIAESDAALSQFTKPPHISDEQFSAVKQRVEAQRTTVDLLKNFSGDRQGRMQAESILNLSLAVQKAAEGGTTAEQIAASAIVASGPRVLETLVGFSAIEPSDLATLFGKVSFQTPEAIAGGNTSDSPASLGDEFWTQETIEKLKGRGKDAFNDYSANATLLLHGLDPNVFLNDPEKRGAAASTISAATRALYNVAAGGDTLSAAEYQGDLMKSLESNIESFKDAQPELYDKLRGQLKTAIDTHAGVLGPQIASEFAGKPVVYNPSTGEVRVTRGAILDSPQLSQGKKVALLSAVDKFYGGDLQAAIEDQGKKITAFVSNPDNQFGEGTAEDVTKFRGLTTFFRDVDRNLYGIGPETRKRIQAFKHLQKLKGRFTEEGDDTTVLDLIDQTEAGSGGYDSLFADAQDGRFAGFKVTTKTLGELKEFTEVSGDYGQWVKGVRPDPENGVSTPLGRYQIVGTLLREIQEELGLGDDVVFTPQVQDQFFRAIYNKTVKPDRSDAENLKALRNRWQGFEKVKDPVLLRAMKNS